MSNLREIRREQIILAAIEVFGEHGFFKGTVSQIAQEAGLGKGTIYEYFNSKDEIFDEMLLYIIDLYEEDARRSYDIIGSSKEKITQLLEFNYNFLNKYDSLLEQMLFRIENISEKIRPRAEKLHRAIYNFILDIIEEGIENNQISKEIDKHIAALIIMNIFNKAPMKDLALKKKIETKEIVDIIFKGLEGK